MPLNMLSGDPSGGRTAYGSVPGPISTPPNLFAQLSGLVPGFTRNTGGAGSVISSQLAGTVSPATLNALKTASAQFGVGAGMPGSGLEANELFGNIAGFSEGQQQKGVQNYLSEVGALGPTMTNPNLAAEIAARNAAFAAAPDPKLAAQEAFNTWLKGFGITSSAGTPNMPWDAGGTLGPAPAIGSTVARTYPGVPGFGYGTDSLGFPNYDMTPAQYGTATVTATPPPGGWTTPPAWNAGFATGGGNNPYFYTGDNPDYAGEIGGG